MTSAGETRSIESPYLLAVKYGAWPRGWNPLRKARRKFSGIWAIEKSPERAPGLEPRLWKVRDVVPGLERGAEARPVEPGQAR